MCIRDSLEAVFKEVREATSDEDDKYTRVPFYPCLLYTSRCV